MTLFQKVLIAISIISIILTVTFGSLWFNQKQSTKNIDDAGVVNNEFIDKFFNYSETSERYTQVKDIMSATGYKQLFPSGISMPTSKIESKSKDLTVFQDPNSTDSPEFVSRFSVETTFQDVSSREDMVIRTQLKKQDDQWVINDVEIIADIPADEGE